MDHTMRRSCGIEAFCQGISSSLAMRNDDPASAFQSLRTTLVSHRSQNEIIQALPDHQIAAIVDFLGSFDSPIHARQTEECASILRPVLELHAPHLAAKLPAASWSAAATVGDVDGVGTDSSKQDEPNAFSDFFDVSDGKLIDRIDGPDEIKLQEVKAMERKFNKKFPHLVKRFEDGTPSADPAEVLALVNETVDYMMAPVEAVVPAPTMNVFGDRVAPAKPHIIVLIGLTGAGKSTVANWLAGHRISKRDAELSDDDQDEYKELVFDKTTFKVGHDAKASQTFAPTVQELSSDSSPDGKNVIMIDYPGFLDTSGFEIRIGMDIAFRSICEKFPPLHVLALMPIESFGTSRGSIVKQQLSKMKRLLPILGAPIGAGNTASEQHSCTWKIGVTKCDGDFIKQPKRRFREAVQLIEGFEKGLGAAVINMNEKMFSDSTSEAARSLLHDLCRDTRTPLTPQPEMVSLVQKAFGCATGNILSDCLNPNDVAKLAQVLMADSFAQSFVESDIEALRSSDLQVSEGRRRHEMSDDVEAIEAKVARLTSYAKEVNDDSKELVKKRTLSLERRSSHVRTLCTYQQCRLKSCFVQAEEAIMLNNLKTTGELLEKLEQEAHQLNDHQHLRGEDFEAIRKRMSEARATMQASAIELGYDGIRDLIECGRAASGVAVVSGGGLFWYVAAYSKTLMPWLMRAGALGPGAALTLTWASGLVLGGLAGWTLFQSLKNRRDLGDQFSGQIKDSFLRAFDALVEANQAAAAHRKAMAALKTSLGELEIQLED